MGQNTFQRWNFSKNAQNLRIKIFPLQNDSKLEPVISLSPEHISVIPKFSQIKFISVLPIRPIF